MKKKIVAVLGSPRRNGSSETLLNQSLEILQPVAEKTTLIRLSALNINPCTECGSCYVTGDCIIRDAMTPLYHQILDADVILVATPIFFSTVPAQLKVFIDRFQSIWAKKFLLKKKVRSREAKLIAVVTGAREKEEELSCTLRPLKALAATIDADYAGEIAYLDVENPTDLPPVRLREKRIKAVLDKAGLLP